MNYSEPEVLMLVTQNLHKSPSRTICMTMCDGNGPAHMCDGVETAGRRGNGRPTWKWPGLVTRLSIRLPGFPIHRSDNYDAEYI